MLQVTGTDATRSTAGISLEEPARKGDGEVLGLQPVVKVVMFFL